MADWEFHFSSWQLSCMFTGALVLIVFMGWLWERGK